MEPTEYDRMFEVEGRHWWYRALRDRLGPRLAARLGNRESRVLDAGCGTGGNLAFCVAEPWHGFGIDFSPRAVSMCRERGISAAAVGSVNRLPFPDESFDCVLSCDVLCCEEVDDVAALSELARVTRRGGFVLLTLPAYQVLSSEHDRAVHCVRRYTAGLVRERLRTPLLELSRVEYLFPMFLPAIAIYRLFRTLLRAVADAPPTSDVHLPAAPLNASLARVARWDRRLAAHLPLGFGSTVLAEFERR